MSDRTPENSLNISKEQVEAGLEKMREVLEAMGDTETLGQSHVNEMMHALPADVILRFIELRALGEDQEALDYLKDQVEALNLNIVLAETTDDKGVTELITNATLLSLMNRGLDKEEPDAKAADQLKTLLGAMLEYADTQQEFLEDPVAAKTLEGLRVIFEYLQRGIEAEESLEKLEKFFKGQVEFMAISRPAGIEELLKIRGGKIGSESEDNYRDRGGIKITFPGKLDVNEQKISDLIDLTFTHNNVHGAKTNLNREIRLSLREVMGFLDKKQTARNRTEFRKQLEEQILPTIARTGIELKGRDGNWLRIYKGATVGADVKRDIIYFKVTEDYAKYLNAAPLSQYNNKTLYLGSSNNPLPFYLARKLQDHYFMDGNRSRKDKEGNPHPNNNILKVKTLLSFCDDFLLPSYEYVQQTDRGHWVKRIRKPLEAALDDIKDIGLFEWEYCKAGLAEATPQEINTNDYRKWGNLYITFKLIPEEPDQTERLEHKRKRLEAEQAEQALKDAETLVKANKIKKSADKKRKKRG